MATSPKELIAAFFNMTKGALAKNEERTTVKLLRSTISVLETTLKKIDKFLKANNVDIGKGYESAKDKVGKIATMGKNFFSSAKESIKEKGLKAFVKDKSESVVSGIKDKFNNGANTSAAPPEGTEDKKESDQSFLSRTLEKLNSTIEKLTAATTDKVDSDEEKFAKEKNDNLEKYQKSLDKQKAREDRIKKEVEAEKNRFGKDGKSKKEKGKGFFSGLLGSLAGMLGSGGMFIAKMVGKGIWKTMTKLVPWMAGALAKQFGGMLGSMAKGALKMGAGAAWWGVKQVAGLALRGAAAAAGAALTVPGAIVIGVGLALFGGYKLYKYLNRNSTGSGIHSDLTRLRLHLYGFNDAKREHYNKLFDLEMLMKDYHDYRNNGVIFKPFDEEFKKKLMTIFGISREDKDKYSITNTWFTKRFMPSWKAYMEAFYAVNPKIYLDDLDKFKPPELFKLVTNLRVPISIYDVKQVPTFDNPETLVDKQQIDDLITKIQEDIKRLTDENKGKDPITIRKDVDKQAADIKAKQKAKNDQIKASAALNVQTPNRESTLPVGKSDMSTGEDAETAAKADVEKISSKANQSIPQATGEMVKGNSQLEGIKSRVPMEKIHSLDPNVLELFTGMAKEYMDLTGRSVTVSEAFRTFQDQAALRQKYGARAAPPGRSLHEFGLAIDVDSKDADELDKLGLMRKYGFTRPIGGERWHLEPVGVSMNPTLARDNKAHRLSAILSSPGRGGGGYATDPSARKYKRNTELQKFIYNSGKSVEVDPLKEVAKKMEETPPLDSKAKPVTQGPSGTSEPSRSSASPSPSASTEPRNQNRLSGVNILGAKPETNAVFDSQSERESKVSPKGALDDNKNPTYSQNPNMDMANTGDQSPEAQIRKAASVAGMDPQTMIAFAKIESSLNPKAKNPYSSAEGYMQILDGTWDDLMRKYSNQYNIPKDAKKTDGYYNALLGSLYARDNMKMLGDYKSLGVRDDVALYMAHHFGPGGGKQLITAMKQNPQAGIRSVVSENVYSANKQELGGKTIAEYVQYLGAKMDRNGSKAGAGAPPVPTAPATTPTPTTTASAAPEAPSETPEQRVQDRTKNINLYKRETPPPSPVVTPSPFQRPQNLLPEQPLQPSKALSLDKTESLLSGMSDTLLGIRTILQSIDSKQGMQSEQPAPSKGEASPQRQAGVVVDSNTGPSTNSVSMSRKPVRA